MTQEELNYIKDSFSQILDDIGGNPDWYDAAKAVASDLGTIEKQLEERVTKLPSNLDEAAKECAKTTSVKVWGKIDPKKDLKGYMARANYGVGLLDGFYAGAEWMAGQFHFVTAHCCESANPASESVDKPLHLITLIYEDDDKNPYIVGGDDVEVCLRKK